MTAPTAPQAPGIWFVYRSHHEGPLGKRVRRVAAPSILAWFQAKIDEARTSLTPHRVADADLGGPVPGLAALFEAAKQHALHTPKSSSTLTKFLHDHLHGEGGGADELRVDAHAVRVFTSDDAGEVAWFFFDDEALRKTPRNLAFLLHDEPRLPEGDGDRAFAAAAVPVLGPVGTGEGATYACFLTSYGRRSLVGRAGVIPGVRLPDLAAHLLATTPEAAATSDGHDGWPIELRLLRSMLEPGDTTLTPALTRAAAYPLGGVVAKGDHANLGQGALDVAQAAFVAAAEGLAPRAGDPPIVYEGKHSALLAGHTSAQQGHQPWILFDDRWAAANPDLATSLVHYVEHADPFAPLRATKAPIDAATPATKTAKPKAKGPSKAKIDKAASKDAAAWAKAVGDRDVAAAQGYRTSGRFDTGALLAHAKFGVGVVTRTEGTKCEVLFKDGPRLLVHGASA
jgi:hypothetical protein